MITSPARGLIAQDIEKWGKNLVIFSAPAIIIFLTALSQGVPWKDASMAMYPAFINALLDLFRKWLGENTYE